MPWFTQESKTEEKKYWLPEEIPEPTPEWNELQRNKRYLLPDWTTRSHPNWYFLNGALVSDEYLLINDGWKLLIDNYPTEIPYDSQVRTDPPESWTLTETTATVTYSIYQYVRNFPQVSYEQTYKVLPESQWTVDEENKIITCTYEVRDLTLAELDAKDEETWFDLRYERNKRLQETDYAFVYAIEKGLEVSNNLKDYRQNLRDLPANIVNIRTFDFHNSNSWPTKPNANEYFITGGQ